MATQVIVKIRPKISGALALAGRKTVGLANRISPLDPFPFGRELAAWRRDGGDEQLKFVYPLDSQSLVLDVGGFKGEWAMNIYARYSCTIHVLEPVAAFYRGIEQTFQTNEKLVCHAFGLSDQTQTVPLAILGDGSSVHRAGTALESIRLVDVAEFFAAQNIEKVDLMKLNVEGGEFEILPRLIETGLIGRVENILVQFHLLGEESRPKRAQIQEQLRATHELAFCYDFIWESWKLREPKPA